LAATCTYNKHGCEKGERLMERLDMAHICEILLIPEARAAPAPPFPLACEIPSPLDLRPHLLHFTLTALAKLHNEG
jgi:hypothetical protein